MDFLKTLRSISTEHLNLGASVMVSDPNNPEATSSSNKWKFKKPSAEYANFAMDQDA